MDQSPASPRSLPSQEQGLVGRLIGAMVRQTVRKRFRAVYWNPPTERLRTPTVLVANHHGWHDGYLMYHVLRALEVPALDWIQEYASFPLFGKIGGMPFPADQPGVRAATIRTTIRRMKQEGWSLCLFAEGVLHRPPGLLEFGKSLGLVCRQVPGALVTPVTIHYDMSMHERPEAFLRVGAQMEFVSEDATRAVLVEQLESLRRDVVSAPESFELLARGTLDINERWDSKRKRASR